MSRTARTPAAAPPAPAEGYTWPELRRLTHTALTANVSVLLRGHPGVGKSTLASALAGDLGLELIDIRLAQRDPTDLAGVWMPDRDRQALVPYPPSWALDAASRPCLVFLDEINAGVTKLHQAAAYQIVLERRVGALRLHPETRVLAAGNLEEDNAIVTPLSSALANRFAHFTLRVDAKSWVEWGSDAGVEPSVLAYIAGHGESALYTNDGQDIAFPSPRSWAMASALLAAGDTTDGRRLVAACVGVAAAERFFAWRRIYGRVNVDRILKRGEIPDFTETEKAEPSFIYAAVMAVAAHVRGAGPLSGTQLTNLVRFLQAPGLDPEYTMLLLRHTLPNATLHSQLRDTAAFRALAATLVGIHAELYR